MNNQKKIFISYSWDSPEHKAWVKQFSDDLQDRLGKGFKVLLDQNLTKGASYSRFMKLGLKEADKVLIIGTPKYKEKSEASRGVAYETMVITNEMLPDMDTKKFYPILRSGTFETSFPTDIKDRIGDDFRDDTKYEDNLKIVADALNNVLTTQNLTKSANVSLSKEHDKKLTKKNIYSIVKILFSIAVGIAGIIAAVYAVLSYHYPKQIKTEESHSHEIERLELPPNSEQNSINLKKDNRLNSFDSKNQIVDHLVFTVGNISFKMIRVEGGTFQMGAKEDDSEADDNEKPAHQVELPTFYIGETEVSYALWDAVHEKGTLKDDISSHKDMQNRPVENVSWNQCKLFIEMLNAVTGRIFRLPTEAEWEYAARGGQKSESFKYSGSNKVDDVAWYDKNSYGETHDVARRKANELGLYDMSGNVWEWCYNPYEKYSGSPQKDPQISGNDNFRVFRGGGYYGGTSDCRVTSRKVLPSGERLSGIGFRLALSE